MKAKKWIGVDIHKKQITICIMKKTGEKEHHVYPRTSDGLNEFFNHVDSKTIVGVESTTWTRDFACKCIKKAQDVIIFNTVALKEKMSKRLKTDKVDSAEIALILRRFEKNELSTCMIKSEEFAEIKGLLNIRERLVRRKTESKNEIIAMLDYWGSSRTEKFFIHIEKDKVWINEQIKIPVSIRLAVIRLIEIIEEYELQIKELDEQIETKLNENKGYNAIRKSIKGVGKTTAAYLITKIEDIKRFESHKKLVSYLGLSPKVKESDGKGYNGHISKETDKGLLRVLVQASWICIKYDMTMKKFYENLIKRMCKQKAIIAVARKLVVNTFFVLKQAEA